MQLWWEANIQFNGIHCIYVKDSFVNSFQNSAQHRQLKDNIHFFISPTKTSVRPMFSAEHSPGTSAVGML